MITVVLGHTFPYGRGILYKLIFSFHMPVFFFLSGYTFVEGKYSSLKDLFRRKLPLLKAFALATCAGIIITLLIPEMRADLSLKAFLMQIYTGYLSLFHNGAVWFLLALFWTIQEYYLLNKVVMHEGSKKEDFIIMVFSVILMLIYIIYREIFFQYCDVETLSRLPLRLDSSLFGLFFFALGHCSRKISFKHRGGICFLLIIINISTALLNRGIDVNACQFGYLPLFYIAASAGSVAILLIGFELADRYRNKGLVRHLEYIGRNSLLYLCSQMLVLRVTMILLNRALKKSWKLMDMETPWYVSVLLAIWCLLVCHFITGFINEKRIK